MLDAAHGETERPVPSCQRIDIAGDGVETPSVEVVGSHDGRTPPIALGTDTAQRTRFIVAVARSRRSKQSLGGMTERLLNE